MKVIIVGATGFIGGAILRRALVVDSITSIVTLSRRELPSDVAGNPKIKNILLEDFTSYSSDVLNALEGARTCIWALGGRVPQFPTYEAARAANVTYLHAFASAIAGKITPEPGNGAAESPKLRFVYCSGMFTEHDQAKKLFFLEQSRKLKGEAETGLLEIEGKNADALEVLIARPAGVLEKDGGLESVVYGSMGIGKGVLAAAMVEMAVKGAEVRILENQELKKWGRVILKEG